MADDVAAPFPLQDSQIADDLGKITLPWSRLFVYMWNLIGQGRIPVTGAVNLALVAGELVAYDAMTGVEIGVVPLENTPGGPVVPVVAGASPQTYVAISDGVLVVFGAAVEMSRDGLTWYQASLTGGPIPLKTGDHCRFTWYSVDKPVVTWFPTYAE